MSGSIFFFCAFCVHYFGFTYGLFMQVIPPGDVPGQRERWCRAGMHSLEPCDLIGLKLTIKDVCLHYSDEASGDVGVSYLCARCACVSLSLSACVCSYI